MSDYSVYTDGSCHTQLRIGGWAALMLIDNERVVMLSDLQTHTTHNRMELTAVIEGIRYAVAAGATAIEIYSDSQYVVGLSARENKLRAKQFITAKGNEVVNADLVKELLSLSSIYPVTFVKVQAHQKKTEELNYNIEVDKECRRIVREAVGKQ